MDAWHLLDGIVQGCNQAPRAVLPPPWPHGLQSDKRLAIAIINDTRTSGQFDLVSSDGSLRPDIEAATLDNLWPALKPGGAQGKKLEWTGR